MSQDVSSFRRTTHAKRYRRMCKWHVQGNGTGSWFCGGAPLSLGIKTKKRKRASRYRGGKEKSLSKHRSLGKIQNRGDTISAY